MPLDKLVTQFAQQASELSDDEREAFISALNEPYRSQVQHALGSGSQSGQGKDDQSFLDPEEGLATSPGLAVDPEAQTSTASRKVPKQIGNYKVLQEIGQGGMGAVYMAEQTEPVRRRVAIKVIRSGMDSKEVIARFEAERQALAMMDHQNIARVLDAGKTEDEQPYFVMELVKGIPLNQFCDMKRLGIRKRLTLMIDVCSAIQHAHQKGIIHRDLKPSNILVTLYDGEPVAKVIDFGLAKALEHSTKLTDKTMFTHFGQVVGTLQYMSPEQAELNALDVDTRTDVYSLGVMLYELVTGSTPVDKATLSSNRMLQVLEMIREKEPPRPLARLSSSGNAVADISKQRDVTPAKLRQLLSSDLEWIIMKALEKERSRRYATASELADDLRNFLNDDPIAARPPSRLYLASKFVRKNRGLVVSAATVLLTLVAAVVVCAFMAVSLADQRSEALREKRVADLQADEARRAREDAVAASKVADAERVVADRERQRAEEAAAKAKEQEQQAELERRRAQQEALVAEAVQVFLQDKLLSQASVYYQANSNPDLAANANLTVREALQRAAEEFAPDKIKEKFPGKPYVQAEILETIAQTLSTLGEGDQAVETMDAAIAIREASTNGIPLPPELVSARTNRVFVLLMAKKHTLAIEAFAESLQDVQKTLELTEDDFPEGTDVDREIDRRTAAMGDALDYAFDITRVQFPRYDPKFNPLEMFRAGKAAVSTLGVPDKLHAAFLKRYGPKDKRTIIVHMVAGFQKHAIAHLRSLLAESSNPLVKAMAATLAANGSFESAIEAYDSVVTDGKDVFEDEGLRIAGVKVIKAMALLSLADELEDSDLSQPRQLEAIECLQQSRIELASTLPKSHPATLMIDDLFTAAMINVDRDKEVIPLLTQLVERQRKMKGAIHHDTLIAISDLADSYRWVAMNDSADGEGEPRMQKAIELYQECYDLGQRSESIDDNDKAVIARELAIALGDVDRHAEAARYFREEWQLYQSQSEMGWAKRILPLRRVCSAFEHAKESEKTIDAVRELALVNHREFGSYSHPIVIADHLRLASLLIAAGQNEEAQKTMELVGRDELGSLRVSVSPGLDRGWDFRGYLLKCGWSIIDFDRGGLSNGREFGVTFERSADRAASVLQWDLSETEFAAKSNERQSEGYSLIRKEPYTVDGEPRLVGLWQRNAARD